MRLATTLFTLVLVCAAPMMATAQSNPRAAATHTADGAKLLKQGRTDDALAQFVLAYAYDPTPERLADLARAYEAKGQATVARDLYQRVVDTAPKARIAVTARERVSALSGSGAAAGQTLTLTVMPPGATVTVDGRVVGKAPLAPIALPPGPHQVVIRLAGYKTVTESVTIAAGQSVNRLVTMQPGQDSAPAVVKLQITKLPAGAQVTVNGQAVAVRDNLATTEVTPGSYTIRVTANGKAPFVKTMNLTSGSRTVVYSSAGAPPAKVAARTGPSTSLTGEWFALEMPDAGEDRRARSARLTMASESKGSLVVEESMVLPRWKQKQCGGKAELTWKSTYNVRIETAKGGGRIVGNRANLECSCEGQCRSDDSVSIDVLIPDTKNAMINDRYLFQRMRGSTAPASPVRAKPDLTGANGQWLLRWGKPGSVKEARVTLQGGAELTGTAVMEQTTTIQRWRRKECGGQEQLTATQHFRLRGEVDGNRIKVSFDHEKFTDCNCNDSVCKAAALTSRVPNQTFYMTLDGSAFIARDAVLARVP